MIAFSLSRIQISSSVLLKFSNVKDSLKFQIPKIFLWCIIKKTLHSIDTPLQQIIDDSQHNCNSTPPTKKSKFRVILQLFQLKVSLGMWHFNFQWCRILSYIFREQASWVVFDQKWNWGLEMVEWRVAKWNWGVASRYVVI